METIDSKTALDLARQIADLPAHYHIFISLLIFPILCGMWMLIIKEMNFGDVAKRIILAALLVIYIGSVVYLRHGVNQDKITTQNEEKYIVAAKQLKKFLLASNAEPGNKVASIKLLERCFPYKYDTAFYQTLCEKNDDLVFITNLAGKVKPACGGDSIEDNRGIQWVRN